MKTLNEYINESLLGDLDDLETSSNNVIDAIEKDLIEKFLEENYIIRGKYTIKDGIVDVKGSITVKNKNLTELTNGMFVFGSVGGNFNCDHCVSLTSLKGAPEKVDGSFACYECKKLTSLKDAPKEVGGSFYCSHCNSLTSLEGAPKKVGIDFDCSWCDLLTSLKDAPEKVGDSFACSHCNSLTSLEGAPKKVKGIFICYHCRKLTSLKGAPKEVGRDFHCTGCGVEFTKKQVAEVSKVKSKIYV